MLAGAGMPFERYAAAHARVMQLVGLLGVVAHEVNVPGSAAAGEMIFMAQSWLREDPVSEIGIRRADRRERIGILPIERRRTHHAFEPACRRRHGFPVKAPQSR